MRYAAPSRDLLAETLLAAGPDAPTLCEGWLTRHMAAHLYLREHSARIGLGQMIKPLHAKADELTAELALPLDRQGYEDLVEKFRRGPSRLNPMGLGPLDEAANVTEYFVHTEDVRRASDRWAPRTLDAGYSAALWRDLIRASAFAYRGLDVGVVLVQPDGPRHVARRAAESVAIVGDPGELLLHANGRSSHALVTFEGAPDAITLFKSSFHPPKDPDAVTAD